MVACFLLLLPAIGLAATADVFSKDSYLADASHYYPDCALTGGEMRCAQRPAAAGALRVAWYADAVRALSGTDRRLSPHVDAAAPSYTPPCPPSPHLL